MAKGTLSASGFNEVQKELNRIAKAQAPAINAAVKSATEFGQELAIDQIYDKYGFKSKSYVEQHFRLSIDPKRLQGRVTARYRPSSLTRFANPRRKASKNGRPRLNGFDINVIRNQPVWFRGAFTVTGRNGNEIMFMRKRGETWRSLRGQKALYGPSVGGSFAYIRDDIEPKVIRHLREKYHRHSK